MRKVFMSSHEDLGSQIKARAEQLEAILRQRHPGVAAHLDRIYRTSEDPNHPGTWWLERLNFERGPSGWVYESSWAMQEPYGSQEAAEEARRAAILGGLIAHNLSEPPHVPAFAPPKPTR